MKKIIISFAILIIAVISTNAQTADSTKLFQKITGGLIFGAIANASFSGEEKPFNLNYNLSPTVTVITPKTYHNILYGFGNNSLRSLNGLFLKKDWDAYVIYSRILHTRSNYLGCGIEKMTKISNNREGVRYFIFAEVGTDLKGNESLSLGLLMNIRHQFWKR